MRIMLSLKALWLGAACLLGALQVSAATPEAGEIARPDGARHYLLAVPAHTGAGKRPLVILLHGHGGSAAQILGQTRMASPLAAWLDIADRERLLLIAPDGVAGKDGRQGWNDCRADASTNPATDDTGLIGALIDMAVARHDADPARVYVIGMSNGGMMAYRLASELGPRLAAFAAISASMPAQSRCAAASTPLSALIVGGTADPVMPYAGGAIKLGLARGRGSVIGAEATAAFWRTLDQLPAQGREEQLAHRSATDPTRSTRTVWRADPHTLQVALVTITQGGHVEPSPSRRISKLYGMLVGPQSGDLEMAEEAWHFFQDKRAVAAP